jgi:hypothetical protein
VRQQHAEIADLEAQLADLDRWTVAGLWLAPALASREPAVTAAWHRLYPPDRDREELFLALAGVADRCGVEAFALEEDSAMDAMGSHWSRPGATDPAMAADAPPSADPEAGMMDTGPAPVAIALDRYRVRARFQADYARIAAFVAGLQELDRAIDVRHLAIRPGKTGLDVEMEMQVYVSTTHAS